MNDDVKKYFTFEFDEDLKKKFEEKCNEKHRSMSQQMRHMIVAFNEGRLNITDGE